jgi:hypothetical protein
VTLGETAAARIADAVRALDADADLLLSASQRTTNKINKIALRPTWEALLAERDSDDGPDAEIIDDQLLHLYTMPRSHLPTLLPNGLRPSRRH